VHHRVDVAVPNNFGDKWITDIGTHELGPAHAPEHVLAGRDRVDRDDAVDQRVLREAGRQIAAQEAARASDQHHFGVVHVVAAAGPAAFPVV
jgi:hypothetical protein